MAQNSGSAPSDTSPKFQASCPYIGMMSDPQTHVGTADSRNYCHLVNPPCEIMLAHQQGFCLSNHFNNCEVYKTSGDGKIPEGIFENSPSGERRFALPFLFARRSQAKASNKSKEIPPRDANVVGVTPEPVKPQTIDPIPVVAAAVAVHGEPEVVAAVPLPTTAEPVAAPKPVSEAVQPNSTFSAVPAVTVATMPQETVSSEGPEDDEAVRMRLYNEALSRYEQVNNSKRDRKGLWIFILVVALVILIVSGFGAMSRYRTIQRDAQVLAEIGYAQSLATAVQNMGAAGDAWGTAAGVMALQQRTATISANSSATAERLGVVAQETAQAATAFALTATPTQLAARCQNVDDVALSIVSGPDLSPSLRTIYQVGQPKPKASWIVQNSGTCGWAQLMLWSVLDNTISQPIVKRNGLVLTPIADSGPMLIAPGEQIELIIEFLPSSAERINGDWVLVVDGLSMVAQPHLELKVNDWVSYGSFGRPTSTPRTSSSSSGSSGGGGGSGSGGGDPSPPSRDPSPVPPTR